MPNLTKAEDILHQMETAFVPQDYNSIYAQMQQAFNPAEKDLYGPLWENAKSFPNFPDIRMRFQEVGVSKRILSTQFTTLSKVLRAPPEPEFTELDPWTAEVRKQFCLSRFRGYGGQEDWMDAVKNAFMEGDGFGTGIVQIGLKTNPKTAQQYVCLKHVPILQVLWDRNHRSFGSARWACFLEYLSPDESAKLFGWKKTKEHMITLRESGKDCIETVRYFEFWDIGYEKGEPTKARILGDITNKPEDIDENDFGFIPAAHYEHLLLPGMRRAVGRITLLMGGQEGLNEGERRMRAEMRKPSTVALDPTLYEPADLERYEAGEPGTILRTVLPIQQGQEPFTPLPGGEVTASTLQYYEIMNREFIAMSGVNELEMGQDIQGAETLGEVELVDQRSATQGNYSVFQLARFVQRMFDKVCKVAAIGDTDPLPIDVFGNNVLLNDPSQPNSAVEVWMEEPSKIVVSEDTLLKADETRAKAQKQGELMSLSDLIPTGIIDPVWWTEQRLKNLGYDPKDAMRGMEQRMMQAQMGQQQQQMAEQQAVMGAPPAA